MFGFKLKSPKIDFPAQLVTKDIMIAAGVTVVNNYKLRLNEGKGVKDGTVIKLKPLSEITKRNRGEDAIPLVDKGLMKDSFRVDTSQSTDKKATMNFPPNEAFKAGVHQKGVTIKPKNAKMLRVPFGGEFLFLKKVTIPSRPHVGFSEKDVADALKMINTKVLTGVNEGIRIEKPT